MESFEELVKTIEPDARFEYIVKDILRDKASGWVYNYYANSTSQWHERVIKHKMEIASMQQVIKKNNKTLATFDLQIQNSKLDPKDLNYKPLKKGEFEKIDATYTDLAKENIYLADDIKAETKEHTTYSYLDYICSMTNKNMYALRNKFQIDGDLDYLRKGVTLSLVQQYRHLGKSLPPLITPSFSYW